MPDQPYSKREIDGFQHDVRESLQRIEVDMNNGFKEVHKKQDLTNGNVTRLQLWRSFISGAVSILAIIIVPMLGWALWVLVNIQGQVGNAVDDALSAYQIEK